MNDTRSSAGTAWFAVPHADVARRTNVAAVTLSFVLIVLGIAAFVASFSAGDAGSTLSLSLMTGGSLLLLWGLFSFFWKSKQWVYLPTSSSLSQDSLFFDVADMGKLLSAFQSPTIPGEHVAQVKPNGNVRLDFVFSRDRQFVAAKLYRFVPYTYEPVSPVFYFTGVQSEAFLQKIDSNDF